MLLKLMQAPAWDWNRSGQSDTAGPPRIVGAGDQARIVVMASGAIRTESAAFGLAARPGPRRRPVCSWPAEAATSPHLAALWETQRCLVPISGLIEQHDGLRQTWLCRARAPAFAAGIRSVRATRVGMHVSEFSLLTAPQPHAETGNTGALPLLVSQDALVRWFFMDGVQALHYLRSPGRAGFFCASRGSNFGGGNILH